MLRNLHAVVGGGARFWAFVVLTAASAVIQAAAVLSLLPILSRLLGPDPASAGGWLLVLVALIAVAWCLDVVNARVGLRLGIRVMRTIHGSAPRAIMTWPASILTSAKIARLRTLVSSGAIEATSALLLLISPLVGAVVFIGALGIGLLPISPVLSAVTVGGGAIVLGALWLSTTWEARAQEVFSDAMEELDSRLFEFAWAQPSLRTARRISLGRRAVDRAMEESRSGALRVLGRQVPGQLVLSIAMQMVMGGFAFAAWRAYADGRIDGAGAAALVIILLRVIEQVTVVSGAVGGLLALRRSLAEVRELVEAPAMNRGEPLDHAPLITVRDLRVTYPDGTVGLGNADDDRGVDLDLQPGTVTAIVGRSGSGKTTLLRALAGVLPSAGGTVALDGAAATADELTANATMVFQTTVLGAGTVRDNILAVNPALTDEGLERIAEDSQVGELVARLPHGWEAPAGEWGSQLSGGERQRVGIARALAKPAHLLLVDEATSALDLQAERSVVQALGRVRSDYTTVVVTHRPATVAVADTVVVMEGGRVAEVGTRAELEAAGGLLARFMEEWRAASSWRV
jgi:ABC transporter, ATP-binding protein